LLLIAIFNLEFSFPNFSLLLFFTYDFYIKFSF
jgi:hypothetical protein